MIRRYFYTVKPGDRHEQRDIHWSVDIGQWMAASRLKLNADKTEVLWIGTRNNLNKLTPSCPPLYSSTIEERSTSWYANLTGLVFTASCHSCQCTGTLFYVRNFQPITCYISEMVEDKGVHAARRLTSIELSFDPYNIYRDCSRGVHRGGQNVPKMC